MNIKNNYNNSTNKFTIVFKPAIGNSYQQNSKFSI